MLLSPLLLIQALWVRKNIIKLPEPSGNRTGKCGKGATLKLLILGDSAAAGVGVVAQEQALSGLLSAKLAKQQNVEWQLIAKTGYTSANIINKLNTSPDQSFDYILISIGVNDVTAFTRSKKWQNNLVEIIDHLETKFNSPKIVFSSIPPMHLFTALPQPLRMCLGRRANKLNKLMAKIIIEKQHCSLLSVKIPFSEQYLAQDKFHPSQKAYQLWADQAAQLISISQPN